MLGFGQGYFGQYSAGGRVPTTYLLNLHDATTVMLNPDRRSRVTMPDATSAMRLQDRATRATSAVRGTHNLTASSTTESL